MAPLPLPLDAVGLLDFEQTLADHADHQVLCRENAKSRIGAVSMANGDAIIYRKDVAAVNGESDRGTFARPQASGGE